MKKKEDPRHIARVIVLQALFEKLFGKSFPQLHQHEIEELIELNTIENIDKKLVEQLINCVQEHQKEIDKIIKKYAPKYPIENMDKTNYLILQIAICEGFVDKITPTKVAIDEAVELAKTFCSNESYKFINGVLGKLYEESKR